MLYLLTYDIADPRRLVRLYRALKKRAVPIQYSVFLARLTPARLADMKALVLSIIDERFDDVRFYPLPTDGWQRRLGRGALPDGLLLTMLPAEFRDAAPANDEATAAPTPAPKSAAAVPVSTSAGRRVRAIQRQIQTGQRRGIMLI